jgi:hypothetical protein
MGQAIQVQEGQYYAKVFDGPSCGTLWEVKSVSARFLSLPHARLVNQEDPRDIRMISCDAITDGQFFKLVSEPQRQHTLQDEAAKTQAPRTDDKAVKKPRDDGANRNMREIKSLERQVEEIEHAIAQI